MQMRGLYANEEISQRRLGLGRWRQAETHWIFNILLEWGKGGGCELCYQSARRWFWQILGMLEILWGSLNWIKLNWGQWMWQRRRKPCANRSWPLWLSDEISTKSCQKIPSHPNQSIGFVELILADAKDREESNHLFEMRDSDWFLFIYKFFFRIIMFIRDRVVISSS